VGAVQCVSHLKCWFSSGAPPVMSTVRILPPRDASSLRSSKQRVTVARDACSAVRRGDDSTWQWLRARIRWVSSVRSTKSGGPGARAEARSSSRELCVTTPRLQRCGKGVILAGVQAEFASLEAA
jgi:hypothetical protein